VPNSIKYNVKADMSSSGAPYIDQSLVSVLPRLFSGIRTCLMGAGLKSTEYDRISQKMLVAWQALEGEIGCLPEGIAVSSAMSKEDLGNVERRAKDGEGQSQEREPGAIVGVQNVVGGLGAQLRAVANENDYQTLPAAETQRSNQQLWREAGGLESQSTTIGPFQRRKNNVDRVRKRPVCHAISVADCSCRRAGQMKGGGRAFGSGGLANAAVRDWSDGFASLI
jgi:hypothetical protein